MLVEDVEKRIQKFIIVEPCAFLSVENFCLVVYPLSIFREYFLQSGMYSQNDMINVMTE